MPTDVSTSFLNNSPLPLDSRSTKPNGNPWDSVNDITPTNYPMVYRKPGKQVLIRTNGELVRYWFDADLNLVPEPLLTNGDKGDIVVTNLVNWKVKGTGTVKAVDYGVKADFQRINGVNITVTESAATIERIVEKFVPIVGTETTVFYSDPNGSGSLLGLEGYGGNEATDFPIGSRLGFQLEDQTVVYDFGTVVSIGDGPPYNGYRIIRCTNPNNYKFDNVGGSAGQYAKPLTNIFKFQPAQVPFVQEDLDKVLVVEDARNWVEWGSLVPANVKITAVATNGTATIIDLDNGVLGSLVNCVNKNASFFTNNHDALVTALRAQVTQRNECLELPLGIVGVMPFVSQTWIDGAPIDSNPNHKAVFDMYDRACIKGTGYTTSTLKIEYFGEFGIYKLNDTDTTNPRLVAKIFQFHPIANTETTGGVKDITIELPTYLPTVFSGYTLFSDTNNALPQQHALQVDIDNVKIINGTTSGLMQSSYGGIYDADGNVLNVSRWNIKNCPEIEQTSLDIKLINNQPAGKTGGKELNIENSNFTGGKQLQRYYKGAAQYATDSSGDTPYNYLTVNAPNFSWGIFNRVIDGPTTVQFILRPDCLIARTIVKTIIDTGIDSGGNVTLLLDSPVGLIRDNAIVIANFQNHEQRSGVLYAESVYVNADMITLSPNQLGILGEDMPLFSEQVENLIGKEIRILYDHVVLSTQYPWVNGNKIKVATDSPLTFLGESNLDIICNYGAPNTYHWAYTSHNFPINLTNVSIDNVVSERIIRCSVNANPVAAGSNKILTDVRIGRSVGSANTIGRRLTAHQTRFETFGDYILTRTKIIGVNTTRVVLDNAYFRGEGGMVGINIAKNDSQILGNLIKYGVINATDSFVGVGSLRTDVNGVSENELLDETSPVINAKNCTIELGLANGYINLTDCIGAIQVFENRGLKIVAKNVKFTSMRLIAPFIEVFRNNSFFDNCGLTEDYFKSNYGYNDTEPQLLDIYKDAKTTPVPVYVGSEYIIGYQQFREVGIAKSWFYGVEPANLYNAKNALLIDGWYNKYTLPTCTIEDIVFNSYRSGASVDTWRLMEDFFGPRATVELFCDGIVTFKNSHSLKVISQRPRSKETVIFRWVPTNKCWEEVPNRIDYVSRELPTWEGGNNETVKGAGTVLYYKCIHQVATDYTYLSVGSTNNIPMHTGFQNIFQESAIDNIQYTIDIVVTADSTWKNFTAQYKGCLISPDGSVYPDDKNGYVGGLNEASGTNAVGAIMGIRYKELLGQQWLTITT